MYCTAESRLLFSKSFSCVRQANANCVLFITIIRRILTKTIETCKHTEIYLNFFMVTVSFFVFATTYMITTPVNLIQVRAADLQCSTSCQEELQCQTPTHPTQLQAAVKLSSQSSTSTIAGHLGYKELYLILLRRVGNFFNTRHRYLWLAF